MARQRIERDDSELKYTRSQTRSNATQTHAILRQRPHRFYGSARIGIPVGVPVGSGAAALDRGTAIACTEKGSSHRCSPSRSRSWCRLRPGGPSALATSRHLRATARKKIAFRPFQTGLASRQRSAPLDGRYRKNAPSVAANGEVRHARRCPRKCRSNSCIICNSACSGSIRVPVVLLR